MRILVTGGTGFIGSRLCEVLREDNHEVFEVWRYDGQVKPGHAFWCDVKDGDLKAVVAAANPHIIIHLAAVTSTSYARMFPVETMQTIGVGTARLVEAAQHHAPCLESFVLASTADLYGSGTDLDPQNPYAAAKAAAEHVVRASGLPWTITRPANTYGRGLVDNPQFVVDEAIHQALTTGRIEMRDPNPVRDFMFREDHVDGYRRIVRAVCEGSDLSGETFDFRTGAPVSIREMAGVVADECGVPVPTFSGIEREAETQHAVLGYGRALERLGWAPRYSLRDGVRQAVVEWKANASSIAY